MSLADQATGRAAIERRLLSRATTDPVFRDGLLSDPRAAIEDELGVTLPEGIDAEVIEERPDRLCIVLPMDLSGIGDGAVWAMTGRRPERSRARLAP